MLFVRRHRSVRLLALALLVWLASDTLCHGACCHDLIAFARATSSQVGTTSHSHDGSSDPDDVNHCSCHWQFVPAPALVAIQLFVSTPVVCVTRAWTPQAVARTLERPPQALLS